MRRRRLLAVIALLVCPLPACAQTLSLNTEVDYVLVDQRLRDPDQHTTTSGLLPRLDLSLTGPVRPGARLYLDLTGGLSRNSFGLGDQSTDDAHLVLRGEAPHYRISLRHGTSRFSSTTDTLDLAPSDLTSTTKETGLSLTLRQPAWPVVNMQYSHFTSDSDVSGISSRTEATDTRVAALYDMAPLHFRFDDSHQTASTLGSATSEANARRLGVSIDTALLPKLSLYGDLEFTHTDLHTANAARTGQDGRLGQLRLSAALTPKVAVDAEVHSLQSNSLAPLAGIAPNDLSTRGTSLTMRSEVFPGLQFNLAHNTDHLEYGRRITDVSSTYGDVLAQLNSRNSLAFSFAPGRASFVGFPSTSQRAYRASWTSQLDARTDLVASLDTFATSTPGFGTDRTTSKYLTLRYRPDLQTTVGLGLLWNDTATSGLGAPTALHERGVDVNLAWLPTSTLTLGLDMNLTNLSGASQSRIRVPALDLRWQPDEKGAFTVSWRMQRAIEENLDLLDRLQSTTFSARFQRQLSRKTNLNLSYDVLKFSDGPLAYERRAVISVTTGLGR